MHASNQGTSPHGARVLFAGLLLALAGCSTTTETPLQTLPDLVDRPGLASVGHARAMVHPRGLRFDVQASFVEDPMSEAGDRAWQVTMHVTNTSRAPVDLALAKTWIEDDIGRRFTFERAQAWDPATEEFGPANERVDPGTSAILVSRFPVNTSVQLHHLVRVTAHWRYRYENRVHAVATRFRVR